MLEGATLETVGLRVLSQPSRNIGPSWSGSLARFFDIARRTLRYIGADQASGRLANRSFLAGPADQMGISRCDIDDILSNYPLKLVSPFEETDSIAGGLWSGRALFGPAYDDALAKLLFSRGTLDLPMHTHDYSDRLIVVAAGSGSFWWSDEPPRTFVGRNVKFTIVKAGDVLIFTRGVLHTFSAPDEELLLLSFHSPEIPFADSRQYTIPAYRWSPRMTASNSVAGALPHS